MKRKGIILILLLAMALLAGCQQNDDFEFIFPDYSYENERETSEVENDDYVQVDGILDEEIWESDANLLVMSSKVSDDIKLYSKAHLSPMGVYFGIVVKDNAIYYSPTRSSAYNSSAEIYVSVFGKNQMDAHCLNLRLVPTGDGIYTETWIEDPLNKGGLSKWVSSWKAAATIQGTINTSTNKGYTVEAFVPWSSLGVDEPAPYIQYFPAFNHVETDSDAHQERTWTGYPGCATHGPSTWIVVDNDGIHERNELLDNLIEYDLGMKIDGVLDEDVWEKNNQVSFKRVNTDYSMTLTSHLTDKGFYLGIVVKDKHIFYADESVRPIGLNSGIELYISPYGVDSVTENALQIRIAATGANARYTGDPKLDWPWRANYFPSVIATTIQGTLNAENVEENIGYTIEMFVPWEAMNVQPDNRDKFLLFPCLVHTEDATHAEKTLPWTFTQTGSHPNKHNPSDDYLVMTAQGYQYTGLDVSNIYLDKNNLNGDYYETVFSVTPEAAQITNQNVEYLAETVASEFEGLDEAEIIANEDGTYTLRIHKDNIHNYITPQELVVTSGNLSRTIEIYYNQMTLDGVLDENEWSENYYVTKNTDHNIAQNIKTYMGATGLYLGIEVTDGNVVSDKTHLEVFLTIGEDVGFDQSWQIRFYASGNTRSYVYMTPNQDNWAWREQKLDLQAVIVQTETGYVVEALIPYSTLNLSEAPAEIKLLSYLCFVIPGSSGVTVRDGNNQINNSYGIDINNYVTFDEKGYVPTGMFAENIVFGDGDLVDGFFVKEFHLYTNASKLLKINGANFDSPYFSEISEGLYRISIPEDEIETYTEAQEFVAFLGELSASFTVQYVEMTLDGVLDENEWSENVYVSKNTENDITQVIKSYIGRTGLYIGFEVTDGNVVIDKTHLEVFLNIGEELGIGNTWQFRFYASGTIRTFVYTTPNQDNWAWTEKTGANKLQVQAAIVLTETGYVVEALIPYTTLNLDAAPEEFDLLSLMCFVKAGQSSVNVYDGDTKSSNSHVININNYKPFDGNGYRG